MNERILKLYDQATILEGNGDYVAGELDPVKFAELIVKECMQVADEGMAQVTMKVEWPSYHIKKHFGVEE